MPGNLGPKPKASRPKTWAKKKKKKSGMTNRATIATKLGKPTWTNRQTRSHAQQAKQLWSVVEQFSGHPLLVDFTAKLIERAKVPARDEVALARAVRRFATQRVKFFREYPERFVSPLRTIVWGIGDCDDKSILIASMLRGFRIPVRLKFLRLTLPNKTRVGHVYPQALLDGQWVALESVRPYPWGYDPEQRAREKGFKVETQYVGDKQDTPHA